MPPRKAAEHCKIPYWLSAKQNCKEGRFIQIGNSLLLSDRFQALSAGARYLYLCAAMESGGRPTFTFSRTTATKYGIPARSLRRYIDELKQKQFISVVSCGRTTREKNEYQFEYLWKAKDPT